MTDEPRTLAALQARIRNEARKWDRRDNTLERLVANVVVGQLLPLGSSRAGPLSRFAWATRRLGSAGTSTPPGDRTRRLTTASTSWTETSALGGPSSPV